MPRLSPVLWQYARDQIGFMCPGCGYEHIVTVNGRLNERGASWKWNGDVVAPTFEPSVLLRWPAEVTHFPRCHLYVREGKIQFLSDCSHALKDQTVPMVEIKSEFTE